MVQEAVAFLRETERKDTRTNVVSFNILMSRFSKLGYVDISKKKLCLMFKCGLLHDAYSYNILIHGLWVAGSVEEALEFTNDMEKHGVRPDLVTHNIIVKGVRLLGMMSGAGKIVQRMLKV